MIALDEPLRVHIETGSVSDAPDGKNINQDIDDDLDGIDPALGVTFTRDCLAAIRALPAPYSQDFHARMVPVKRLLLRNFPDEPSGMVELQYSPSNIIVIWKKYGNIIAFTNINVVPVIEKDGYRVISYAEYTKEEMDRLEARDGVDDSFNRQVHKGPSVPEDGIVKPYPGKASGGDVRKYLQDAYPNRPGAEPLTLRWLEQNDPKAFRAIYNQTTPETGPPSDLLPSVSRGGDELLDRFDIDLGTEEGVELGRRLYSLLGSRLYPRRRLKK